jgi:hypothetical protein
MSAHRRSLRLSRPLAAGIAALALAAPAAQARPDVLPSAHHVIATQQQAVVPHGLGQNAPVYWASPAAASADAPSTPVNHSNAPQVRSTDTGFDFTSAAVGAAGLGLIALLAVGMSTVTGRRRMRPTA